MFFLADTGKIEMPLTDRCHPECSLDVAAPNDV